MVRCFIFKSVWLVLLQLQQQSSLPSRSMKGCLQSTPGDSTLPRCVGKKRTENAEERAETLRNLTEILRRQERQPSIQATTTASESHRRCHRFDIHRDGGGARRRRGASWHRVSLGTLFAYAILMIMIIPRYFLLF